MKPRVVMYTTAYCGYCERARRLLRARQIPFDEVDVTHDPARRRSVIIETGHRTVPVILIDGRLIGGSDELVDLARAGGLDDLANSGAV